MDDCIIGETSSHGGSLHAYESEMVVSKATSEVESVNESVAGNSNDHTSSTGKDMLDQRAPPSLAAGTAALGPTSSRPRRGAAAAAASTISQLALSEVQSSPASEDCWPLPSGWQPVLGECRTVLGKAGPSSNETGPSPSETGPSLSKTGPSPSETGLSPSETGPSPSDIGPSPSETGPVLSQAGPASGETGLAPGETGPSRSEAGPASSEALPASSATGAAPEPESCEVCAAPLPEAVSADTVARQTAAALLGTAAAVSWLCRPCADLLGLIDLSRRQLQAMEEQLRQRHRDGSRKKQIIPNTSKVKKEPKEMGECFDEFEQDDREDEGPQQEVEECGIPAEEMIEPAAVTISDAAVDAATAGRKRRIRRAANATKQCSTCGRQFNSWRSLDSHVNVHTGTRPFACTHCERRFPSKAALRQHSGKHSNKWACELCGKLYSTEPALSTHRSYVHFPERLKRLVCNICDKTFLGQKRYTKHMSTHVAEARRFSCPEPGCHSSFKTRNALNVHACKHRGKRFACDQCPALFFSKASMQQHMVRHGSVEAQFPCPHCPRRFIYASILKCHLASSHNAERDRVCEVCGATFTCNSALNAHKLAHQDERPFVCSTCGAAFKRKQVLTRHMRFVHEHEVAVHCEHCDKGFQTLYKLKVHLRTHTGERPFACPCCPKRFTQRSHVRSHMQMHALPGGGVPAPPGPPAELETTPVAPLQVTSVSAGLTASLAAAGALVDVLAVVPAAAGSLTLVRPGDAVPVAR